MITVTINAALHQLESPLSVSTLLERLSLVGKRIAVELNGEIVARSRFELVQVKHGDKLEIVVAVGGG